MKVTENHTYKALIALERLRALHDYEFFLSTILGYDNPKFPEYADPELRSIIRKLGVIGEDWSINRRSQNTYRKVMCILPRGTGKTACLTKTMPVWQFCKDPDLTIGIMSATFKDMAVKFTGSIQNMLLGEGSGNRLKEVMDVDFRGTGANRKWSAERFTIGPRENMSITDHSVAAFSAEKGPTSGHFKIFIEDDPVTKEKMESDVLWLDKIWESYLQLPAVMDKDGLYILINTRYDDADLCGRIITEEIKPRVIADLGAIPPDWDENEGWIKYAHLAGWEVIYRSVYSDVEAQTVVFPVIWPVERIEETRGKGGKSDLFFWTQLMSMPMQREDNPVKARHVHIALGTPEPWELKEAPRTGWVDIFCDFAFKDAEAYKAQRGDFTVAHVCTQRDGFVWRLNGYRGKPTQDIFGVELIKLCYWAKDEWGSRVRFLTFDKSLVQGSGDNSTELWVTNLFRKRADLNIPSVQTIKRNKKKEQYILETAWAWQDGMIRLCKEAPGNSEICHQIQRIGGKGIDDDIDSFSAAFLPDFYKSPARVLNEAPAQNKWRAQPAVAGTFDRFGRFTPNRHKPIAGGTRWR